MKLAKTSVKYALLLILPVLVAWSWRFDFPFGLTPETDGFFGQTAATKDDSFRKVLTTDDTGFQRAIQPRRFTFPKDHGAHDDYRSEWWYFTGNLNDSAARRFGYELTFFRFSLAAEAPTTASAWRSRQLYMAHLALTDVSGRRFYSDERFGRSGNDLAGADSDRFRVWLYDWSATSEGRSDFPLRLKAESDRIAIDLLLTSQKGPVLQGDQGLSRKSAEPGNASYYYSHTRLPTEGRLRVGNTDYAVQGQSWMDREWSTSALSKEQSGWDWFALQLSDQTEVMFYRLRRKDGRPDDHSAGSLILADGSKTPLSANDVAIHETDRWRSPHSKVQYPSRWRLSIPAHQLELAIEPLLADQELNLTFRYWEGAVRIAGSRAGRAISGFGYVELAGYQ